MFSAHALPSCSKELPYSSQSLRDRWGQCCSKLQTAKAHRLMAKAVAECRDKGAPGISWIVSTDS